MAVNPELLDMLYCPKSKTPVELVELPESVCKTLLEKYREHFRDQEPVIEHGLHSAEAHLVYPIVSDIPIMLVDEALPDSILSGSSGDGAAP